MEPNWAAEHLQVIRTLMERSAIYRRALGPIMLLLGIFGLLAAASGWWLRIDSVRGFGCFWMAVSALGVCGAYVMVRRQALRDGEVFWSPPTKRITQAVLPPLFIGLAATVLLIAGESDASREVRWLPSIWMVLYGCALHAAGFFMPRGIKLFGWVFVVAGLAAAGGVALAGGVPATSFAHGIMGLSFGGLHLAYGGYLYFTEPRTNET